MAHVCLCTRGTIASATNVEQRASAQPRSNTHTQHSERQRDY